MVQSEVDQGRVGSFRSRGSADPDLCRRRCRRGVVGTARWRRAVTQLARYDTRCYFNVRSKADISQLSLPHGTEARPWSGGIPG